MGKYCMNKEIGKQYAQVELQQEQQIVSKRPYQKPGLVAYGDVRDITLAGSPGGGESGPNVLTQKSL